MVVSTAYVSLAAGVFCLFMAPAFWSDWVAAADLAESATGDVEEGDHDGLWALLHALMAAVMGMAFLALAAQGLQSA